MDGGGKGNYAGQVRGGKVIHSGYISLWRAGAVRPLASALQFLPSLSRITVNQRDPAQGESFLHPRVSGMSVLLCRFQHGV